MAKQKNLSNEEIASFFRQTSMLFTAGIGPRDAMQILLNDSKNEKGKELITQIRDTCRKGETFATALSETGVFPDYVINMITLGEQSGKTDTCMNALAEFYEKEQAISESLRGALTYPMVMLVMMLVVIIVLVGKVMPIFQQVFNELGTDMTGIAGSMLKIGQALNNYSIVFLCILGVLVLFYIFANHTASGRKLSHNFLIHFPLTKGFYDSVACERFASSLAISISSGMDTYAGLDMAKKMVEHPKMSAKIDHCKQLIREGSNFSEALSSSEIFSNLYSQMVSVGFTSGNPDTVLIQIADSYEKQSTKKIQSILSVLEPTLVIILSLIVGMILLSVILPLMGIMSSIG